MVDLSEKAGSKRPQKSKAVESFVLSTDRIIEIGAGSYESFESQFVGNNSNEGNMCADELAVRYERNRQSVISALSQRKMLPYPF
jgi:hypothetical protein